MDSIAHLTFHQIPQEEVETTLASLPTNHFGVGSVTQPLLEVEIPVNHPAPQSQVVHRRLDLT